MKYKVVPYLETWAGVFNPLPDKIRYKLMKKTFLGYWVKLSDHDNKDLLEKQANELNGTSSQFENLRLLLIELNEVIENKDQEIKQAWETVDELRQITKDSEEAKMVEAIQFAQWITENCVHKYSIADTTLHLSRNGLTYFYSKGQEWLPINKLYLIFNEYLQCFKSK